MSEAAVATPQAAAPAAQAPGPTAPKDGIVWQPAPGGQPKETPAPAPTEQKEPPANNPPSEPKQPTQPDAPKTENLLAVEPDAPKAPEKLNLKLPDGSPLDGGILETLSNFAKANGLNEKQAQAILEEENRQAVEQQKEVDAWTKLVEEDPEIGGDKLDENLELAHRAVKAYASPAFMKQLAETSLGNHPEMVRMFARIGKELAADKIIPPHIPSGSAKKPLEEMLYGKSKENE